MWIYFIIALLVCVFFGILWGYFTILNQTIQHELTESNWRKFLEEEPELWKYNGNGSWTLK
jgi:hypothetical protein